MKVVPFRESNREYAANQPQYESLPAFRFPDDHEGRIVCVWQLTWKERLRVLFTGLVWHQILTFGRPLQPQLLTVEKPVMEEPDATH